MYRYILLVVAILQPLAGGFSQITGIGQSIGDSDSASRLAADQPMAYAFSIWGIIFSLMLIVGIIAVVNRKALWMDRVAMPLALAGALNIIWMLAAQLVYIQPLNFALLFPILGFAWWAAWRMDRINRMGGDMVKATARAAAGLLSGWLTVAVSISVPQTIRTFSDLGATDYPWLMLWSVLATGCALAYLYTRFISRDLWYFVALLWGIAAIILNNWLVTETHWLAIITTLVALIILTLRLTRGARGAMAGP